MKREVITVMADWDISVAHDIYPEVEIIKADASEIDKAWRNVVDGKVKFRYVIDMSTIK